MGYNDICTYIICLGRKQAHFIEYHSWVKSLLIYWREWHHLSNHQPFLTTWQMSKCSRYTNCAYNWLYSRCAVITRCITVKSLEDMRKSPGYDRYSRYCRYKQSPRNTQDNGKCPAFWSICPVKFCQFEDTCPISQSNYQNLNWLLSFNLV